MRTLLSAMVSRPDADADKSVRITIPATADK